ERAGVRRQRPRRGASVGYEARRAALARATDLGAAVNAGWRGHAGPRTGPWRRRNRLLDAPPAVDPVPDQAAVQPRRARLGLASPLGRGQLAPIPSVPLRGESDAALRASSGAGHCDTSANNEG